MILVFLTSGFCCGPKQLLAGQGAGRLSGTRFNFRVVFRVEVRDKQTTGLRAREVVDKHTNNLTSGFCCGPKQLLAGQGAGRLSGTRFNFRVVFRVEVVDKQTNLIEAHILLIPLKISLSKLFRE